MEPERPVIDADQAESISADAGWLDPRYVPLDRSGAYVAGDAAQLDDVVVTRETWDRPVQVSGAVPADMVGVCVLGDDVAPCTAWGRPFSAGQVSLVAGELAAVLGEGATLLAVVVPHARLLRAADAFGLELDPKAVRSSGLLTATEPSGLRVRDELAAALCGAAGATGGAERGSRVLATVADVLARPDTERPETSRRLQLARATRDYLDSSLSQPIRLEDVVRAVGADVRRVQRAFRDVFGTSPFRYLRVSRLRRARLELRRASAGSTTVTRVAHDCGLDHLGRFSVDYRRMYGESPSATLSARPHRAR